SDALDRLHEPFYTAAEEQRLVLPWCPPCRQWRWYPEWLCPHCQAADWEWSDVRGPASLAAWTVVEHAFSPALAPALPFTIALVEFEDAPGVRQVTNLIADTSVFDGSGPAIGSALHVGF